MGWTMTPTKKETTLPEPKNQWVAIIRIRGTVNVRWDVEDTLKLLRLHKPNHCVVMRLSPSLRGMLMKAQNKVAWGEIDFDTFLRLLRERGRVVGDRRLTDDLVREKSQGRYRSIEDLAKAIW